MISDSSFRRKIVVRRMSGGELKRGRWVGQTETPGEILASVQPATVKDLQALEEGRRQRSSWVLFTSTKLNTIEAGQNPDRVVINGDDCEVVTCDPWQNGVRNHFRILIQKMPATAEAAT